MVEWAIQGLIHTHLFHSSVISIFAHIDSVTLVLFINESTFLNKSAERSNDSFKKTLLTLLLMYRCNLQKESLKNPPLSWQSITILHFYVIYKFVWSHLHIFRNNLLTVYWWLDLGWSFMLNYFFKKIVYFQTNHIVWIQSTANNTVTVV